MSRWKKRRKKPPIVAQREKRPQLRVVDNAARVAICVPSDDHVHAAFFMSAIQMAMQTMVREDSGIGAVTIQHVGASILPHSRYTLVKKAMEHDVTHLLFLDSDMTFPADTMIRLLRHDVDMVGVNAMSRRPPYQSTAWLAPGKRAETFRDSTGLEKAWRTGFAVVMLKAKVFEALEPPYFEYGFLPDTDQFRGEDYIFFERAIAAGFELYIDHDLSKQVNHIGSFAFNPIMREFMPAAPGPQEIRITNASQETEERERLAKA